MQIALIVFVAANLKHIAFMVFAAAMLSVTSDLWDIRSILKVGKQPGWKVILVVITWLSGVTVGATLLGTNAITLGAVCASFPLAAFVHQATPRQERMNLEETVFDLVLPCIGGLSLIALYLSIDHFGNEFVGRYGPWLFTLTLIPIAYGFVASSMLRFFRNKLPGRACAELLAVCAFFLTASVFQAQFWIPALLALLFGFIVAFWTYKTS
ncbi:hypothetical protein JNK13_08950 [bacterium]|nr:hypothetical protein [bacterium]